MMYVLHTFTGAEWHRCTLDGFCMEREKDRSTLQMLPQASCKKGFFFHLQYIHTTNSAFSPTVMLLFTRRTFDDGPLFQIKETFWWRGKEFFSPPLTS